MPVDGGVSQAANETGRGATETLKVAGDLSAKGEVLRLEVDNFLTEVRQSSKSMNQFLSG